MISPNCPTCGSGMTVQTVSNEPITGTEMWICNETLRTRCRGSLDVPTHGWDWFGLIPEPVSIVANRRREELRISAWEGDQGLRAERLSGARAMVDEWSRLDYPSEIDMPEYGTVEPLDALGMLEDSLHSPTYDAWDGYDFDANEIKEIEEEISALLIQYPVYNSMSGYAVAFAKLYSEQQHTVDVLSVLFRWITKHFAESAAHSDRAEIIMDDNSSLIFKTTEDSILLSAHSIVDDDTSWVNIPPETLPHHIFERMAEYFADYFGLDDIEYAPWRLVY